jgi:hypothetical protein
MKKMHTLPVIFTGTAPTKSEIQKQTQEIIDRINDSGEINPLKVATAMKALETAMGIIKKGISDAIMEEAEKYQAKTFTFDGHQLQIREAATKYDYTNCGDPEYNRLQEQMENLKEQIKKREAWLKAAPEGATVVDPETGEVHEIYPPAKFSTTSVAITLAK